MTWVEREAIFSKDVITLDEFMRIMNMDKSTASTTMGAIKSSIAKPRITTAGKLHVQDFIDYYRLDIRRYISSNQILIADEDCTCVDVNQMAMDKIRKIRSIKGAQS